MRSWIATTLILAAAACAAPAPRLTSAPDPGTVLGAELFPPYYGQVAVHLTKPAYVALFEVVPGHGVSLLYPRSGSGYQQTTQLWMPMHYNPQRWLYTNAAASSYSGYGVRPYYGMNSYYAGYNGARYAAPPRYLFLLASEEPMDLASFQGSGTAIRSYLGVNLYDGFQPYDVMERLAYGVIPFAVSDQAWTSDVYVDWGYDWGYGPGMTSALASYRTVRCADGTIGTGRYVSGWGWEVPPCVLRAVTPRPSVPTGQPPIGPTTPGDSTATPAGRGRDRGASADSVDRRRAAPDQAPRVAPPPSSADMRRRIAELRSDASRLHFRDEMTSQLKRNVTQQQARFQAMIPGDAPYSGRMRARGVNEASSRNAALERRREAARRGANTSARGSSEPEWTPRARATERDRSSSAPRARPSRPQRATESPSRGRERPSASAPRTTRSSPPSRSSSSSSSKKSGETRRRPPTL